MPGPYTDLDTVKAYMGVGDDVDDEILEPLIQTASDDIADLCEQRFDLGPTPEEDETRLFRGTGRSVRIGPVVEITTLHLDTGLDGTWATELEESVDFQLEPFNAATDGEPWKWATLAAGQTFPNVAPNVKVVGKFGWTDAPSKVKTAAQILAARYYKRKDSPFAIIEGESISTRIARQDPDVYRLLQRFMRGPHQG